MNKKFEFKFENEVLQTSLLKLENGKPLTHRERVELIRLIDFIKEVNDGSSDQKFWKATVEVGSHLWTAYEIIELIVNHLSNSS